MKIKDNSNLEFGLGVSSEKKETKTSYHEKKNLGELDTSKVRTNFGSLFSDKTVFYDYLVDHFVRGPTTYFLILNVFVGLEKYFTISVILNVWISTPAIPCWLGLHIS